MPSGPEPREESLAKKEVVNVEEELVIEEKETVIVTDDEIIIIEEAEIEEFVTRGEPVPKARKYTIRINKTKYTVTSPVLSGRELLALAGMTPDKYKIYQHLKGHHQPDWIEPDQLVDVSKDGIERFTTIQKDSTEGQVTLAPVSDASPRRREFRLPATDEDYLNAHALQWETVKDNSTLWLLIHGWSVPQGYDHEHVSLALMIPGGYPDTQIDMVYVKPGLSKTDGVIIRQLLNQQMLGETWQRWSRHRTSVNPWRVGIDDISTHLALVDEWFRREVN